jgi:putative transposon-encoded protein
VIQPPRPFVSVRRETSDATPVARESGSGPVAMRRCACGVARRMMEEGAVSVKCGDWVLVEDVVAYEGRVVLVIGVTAVISVTCEDTDGDTYRAAELRYCRP